MSDGTPARAFLVLGMHRSGTSCLAGMLSAAGVASAGQSVRNWDNARGHFEALALVRLNESVLAASGGHWLAAPSAVRWSEEHVAERERLLAPVAGAAPLLKDPRTLLCLPFWRASAASFRALGIVRHPLAVARSLAAWRGIPLAEGVALWTAHNRALLADQERHGYPLIDFEDTKDEIVAAVARACRFHGVAADEHALARAFDERLVHHDDHDGASVPGLADAAELHAALARRAGSSRRAHARAPFPNAELERFERALADGELGAAHAAALAALARIGDAAAVAVPVVAALLRARAFDAARDFLRAAATALEVGLAELLRGKLLLARGAAAEAVVALRAACAADEPYYQARRLLPHALRQAGRRAEAKRALAELVHDTLYPQVPLALLAEWSWHDGERAAALAHVQSAIASAPAHRRGRLRARHAEWLAAAGDVRAARAELELALEEDPTYPRVRRELERLDERAGSQPGTVDRVPSTSM